MIPEQMLRKHYEANYDGRLVTPRYSGKHDKKENLWVLPAMDEWAVRFADWKDRNCIRINGEWFWATGDNKQYNNSELYIIFKIHDH